MEEESDSIQIKKKDGTPKSKSSFPMIVSQDIFRDKSGDMSIEEPEAVSSPDEEKYYSEEEEEEDYEENKS